MDQVCNACGGTGKTVFEGLQLTCSRCEGKGSFDVPSTEEKVAEATKGLEEFSEMLDTFEPIIEKAMDTIAPRIGAMTSKIVRQAILPAVREAVNDDETILAVAVAKAKYITALYDALKAKGWAPNVSLELVKATLEGGR